MMYRHQGLFRLFVNREENMPAVKSPGIIHLDGPKFYMSFEKNLFFRIQAAEVFMKYENNLIFFQANALYKPVKIFLEELHVHQWKVDKLLF